MSAFKLPFLPDEHHYAITAVVTRAAQLDSMIEMSIRGFLPTHPESAKFILKNMNGDKYVGLLHALVLDALPMRAEEINMAFVAILKCRPARNEIIHWLWGKAEGEDEDEARNVSRRPFRDVQSKTRTAANLRDLATELLHYVGVIQRWQQAAWDLGQRPSSPNTLGTLGLFGRSISPSELGPLGTAEPTQSSKADRSTG